MVRVLAAALWIAGWAVVARWSLWRLRDWFEEALTNAVLDLS
jgi:hypothetical protein